MKEKWEVGFSGIGCNMGRKDFYTIIRSGIEQDTIGNKTKYTLKFPFENENEAIIFKDYLKTKITRFCLSIYKINQHLNTGELASVPYMPTYTRSWTDEDVAKELGLTDEELQWALKWIPNYYDTDKINYTKL